MSYEDKEFVPASTTTSRPVASKLNANGTEPAGWFAVGDESRPFASTLNRSIVPVDFVVTITCEPSGEKPTWPGEARNCGGFVPVMPSEVVEPSIKCS